MASLPVSSRAKTFWAFSRTDEFGAWLCTGRFSCLFTGCFWLSPGWFGGRVLSVVVGSFGCMSSLVSGVTHPAFAAVEAMNAALDELAEASLWSLPTAGAAQLVVE